MYFVVVVVVVVVQNTNAMLNFILGHHSTVSSGTISSVSTEMLDEGSERYCLIVGVVEMEDSFCM
jgi:hypothetical protein